MKIGVFDSGIGGEAFIKPLQQAFTNAELVVINDRAHVPYGSRTPKEIIKLTADAIQPLLTCDAILLACNTATAVAIEPLRTKYPDAPFVGLEPMIKPASKATQTNVIGVCATPATLKSTRYQQLKSKYASHVEVIEPNCADWAQLIENNTLNQSKIKADLKPITDSACDVLALACTHYHWIRDAIDEITGNSIDVIDPTKAVIRQLRQVLEQPA